MIKQLYLFFFLTVMFSPVIAKCQVIVQINSGSRAPWGTDQNLFIDKNGHCSFYLADMITGAKRDSTSFTISKAQLDSFFAKANQVGFFNLDSRYDGGLRDGAGIFISLDDSRRLHSVDLINRDLPAINELVSFLNRILQVHGIRIYYGQH